MGVRDDLLYFGPRMGFARAASLFARKASKRYARRRVAADLHLGESDEALLARLDLSDDPAERHAQLRALWEPLQELGLPQGEAADPRTLVLRARRVSEGRQMLFGQEIGTGSPPMWEWRWMGRPERHHFGDDIRSTWEVQRLQGLLPLARAARVEAGAVRGHDPEVPASFLVEALVSFARTHPGPDGPAWESALEVGLRLVALSQALPLIVDREAFCAEDLVLLRLLDRHARWLAVDLSTDKVVRGNHLLGELAGLVAVGYLVPAAREAWWGRTRPQELLEEEILRQFHPDGVNVEQSLTYEKFILEFLLVTLRSAALRSCPLGDSAVARLRASVEHLEVCTFPDGTLPRVGDCDSGRGADWGETDPHAPAPVLERARHWLGVAVEPGSGGGFETGLSIRHFAHGGHLVLRGGSPEKPDQIFVRGGPFGWGIPGPASHSHCDLLAPVLTVAGEALLVDPGVYGYRVTEGLRDAFRGWEAHNAVSLEPAAPPRATGTFRWQEIPPPAHLDFTLEGEEAEIRGEVALRGAGNPLRWHRTMRYNGLQRTTQIQDRFRGDAVGPVSWAFHFAVGVEVRQEAAPGIVRWGLPSGLQGMLRVEPALDLDIEEGWVAPSYGRRESAPVLRFRFDPAPETVRITLEITSGVETH